MQAIGIGSSRSTLWTNRYVYVQHVLLYYSVPSVVTTWLDCRSRQQNIPILTVVPQHHTALLTGTLSKGVSSVVSILEGSWGRSIRTVSHPATKFRHGCRLSCCDGHGLRISTVNPADEPRWEEELAQPSFAFVLLQACVFHSPHFRVTSTRARDGFCIPRGPSSCVEHFRSGAVVQCKRSNRRKTQDERGDGVPPRPYCFRCARHVGLLLALHAWLTARTAAAKPRPRSSP